MTAGCFQVDPVALRGASPRFDAAGDRLQDALTTLEDAMSAAGPCWGGDEAGQAFGANYLPARDQATGGFGGLTEALRGVRAALDASAHTWEGTDRGAAGTFGGGA